MSDRELLKNIPASESYDQVLQYFAIERFLYRLAKTEWGERWRSFLTGRGVDAPADLAAVCEAIAFFILPPAAAAACGEPFSSTWDPSGGWSK